MMVHRNIGTSRKLFAGHAAFLCHNAPMSTYLLLKNVHMVTAVATISGFILRGFWMLTESRHLQHPVVKIAPHVVDTLFLLAGMGMIWLLHLNPLTQPWLLAKFMGLIAYILLGTIAIKRGPTKQIRAAALAGAIAAFIYVAGVALAKSPLSWFKVSVT
jgi:uncharacterized membrane protein SirB2